MALELILPGRLKAKFHCRICGHKSRTEAERINHAKKCAEAHRDELSAQLKEVRPPGLFKDFDAEYGEWVRKHGRVG